MPYLGRKGQTAPLASADLPTNSISTAHLINDAVTSAKIGVDVIVAEDLADNSVTVAELADNAVDTNAILDDAVTADKLANSINTDIATGVTANTTANAALPKAGGTMSGNLFVGVGNGAEPTIQSTNSGRLPGNPGFTFRDDLDTGMYQPVSSTGNIAFSTNGTERMRIDSSGNVGIGVSAATKLHISDASAAVLRIHHDSNSGTPAIQLMRGTNDTFGADAYTDWQIKNSGGHCYFQNETNAGGLTTRMTIDSSGKVGIGVTSPDEALNVEGGAGGTDCMVKIYRGGATGSAKSGIYFGASDGSFVTSEAAFIYSANPTNPRGVLYFGVYNSGLSATHSMFNGVFSGDFNDTSDRGLKENIVPIESGALELVNALNPVKFNWKSGKGRDSDNRKIGFIAQDLETVIPEVIMGEDYDPDKADDHTEGHNAGKALNSNGILAVVTKAIQELSAKVTALENA